MALRWASPGQGESSGGLFFQPLGEIESGNKKVKKKKEVVREKRERAHIDTRYHDKHW